MDPGDAVLRRRRHLLPTLTPSAADADAAVGRYRCRLRPLSTAPSTAASVGRRRRHHRRLLTPSPLAVSSATRNCLRPLPLRPPPLAATAASSGLCHRRLRLPPPSTASAVGRSHRRPPWSTRVPRGHLGWWQRLWGPGKSWLRFPQSLRRIPEPSARTGRPARQK